MGSTRRAASRWFWVWVTSISILLSGCAVDLTTSAKKVPSDVRRVYVQTVEGDGYNVDRVIAEQLKAMGYTTVVGRDEKPKDPADVIVTYNDMWAWDMSMYLLKLSIKARDANSGKLLAVGELRRTSMVRNSPEEMARQVLEQLFTKVDDQSEPRPTRK